MKVTCIKDVYMDITRKHAFVKGKTYECEFKNGELITQNEYSTSDHCIRSGELESFFNEHFVEFPNDKTKYVLLYNLGEDCQSDIQGKNKIFKVIPEAKIINEQIVMGKSYEGESIWIPEDKFLIAWTIFNYESLLRINFDEWESELEADDGVEWFERHRNNPSLVRYL